jgi:hypothetical protein
MFFKKEKIIDLNEYTPKELQANVENFILQYHSNKHKNKIFKELSKIDTYLLHMRQSGLSIEYIRQFMIDYFDYKVGIRTLSEYYKVFHKDNKIINP